MTRVIVGILLFAAVAVGGWKLFSAVHAARSNNGDASIETVAAEVRERIAEVIQANGEVAPATATEIKSEISGRIKSLWVEDGQAVTNGQVLLELDPSELESQEEELLRALESSRLRVTRAQRDFERQHELHEKGFVTNKDFDDARTDKELAENDLEIQEARLQTLREKLAKTSVLAPHDGRVIECDLSKGQVIVGADSIGGNNVLMKIADLSQLIVKTDINEVDVTRMVNGMPADVEFDSIPDLRLVGILEKISPSAIRRDNLRVFPIEISCEAANPRIKPGISANVHLTLSEVTDVVAVAISAVFSRDDERFVFVREGNTFARRVVEVGINDAEYVEIKSGLEEGTQVALTRPTDFLAERQEEKDKKKEEKKDENHDW